MHGIGIVLIPHISKALVEKQREHELLGVARVHQAEQDGGGAPSAGSW